MADFSIEEEQIYIELTDETIDAVLGDEVAIDASVIDEPIEVSIIDHRVDVSISRGNDLSINLEGGAGSSEKSIIMQAAPGISIKDIVYQSDVNTVSTVQNNKGDHPAIGIVISVLDNDQVVVQTYGKCGETFNDLIFNKPVFIGADGAPSTSKPSGGYLQIIGWTFDADKIFINPEIKRVKQYPFEV